MADLFFGDAFPSSVLVCKRVLIAVVVGNSDSDLGDHLVSKHTSFNLAALSHKLTLP